MAEIITEKKYPVEGRWIFKSVFAYGLAMLFWAVFFFGSGGYESALYSLVYLIWIPITLIIIALKRATFHYVLDAEYMVVRQGIISKQERHIPYGVIQNLIVKQDLFDRVLGLASLIIENASFGAGSTGVENRKVFGMQVSRQSRSKTELIGFSGNKIAVPGLTRENAEALKIAVLKKMEEHPIEDGKSGL